jgi:hypothetical protein
VKDPVPDAGEETSKASKASISSIACKPKSSNRGRPGQEEEPGPGGASREPSRSDLDGVGQAAY